MCMAKFPEMYEKTSCLVCKRDGKIDKIDTIDTIDTIDKIDKID